ncbi:YIP1 family protein [Rubellimicrobium arenae]|uniref:YIP1 family protein n=1 Tax=Rubellimicrobium arenae TaxID=2817372 RepID=UPI001B31025F|nr:YIP1 family protein [Rubellimicrobium arenae]
MASSDTNLLVLIRDSLAAPGEVASRLLSLRPGLAAVVQAAALVSILDALLLGALTGGAFVIPLPDGDVILDPFTHAALLGASLLISAVALFVGGRVLGGRGQFEQALLVVAWLELLAIVIQVAQLLFSILLPPVAPILALAGLFLLIWCVVQFTRVLHGFGGFGRTILALLLGAIVVGIALTILMSVVGFGGSSDV